MSGKHPEGSGKLKIFLGFAPGVGKTFKMLDEAHRRRRRGQDVVIGAVDTKKRETTLEEMRDLEVVPSLPNGEPDVEAIVRRKPDVVLIDDLAHNTDGVRRWQEVEAVLAQGISVLTTVNVQNLESLNDSVADITGVRVKDTIPDRILHQAEEVELVDLTPRALINRLERGDVYPGEEITPETRDWFREGNLASLRELAMREAAHHVDEDVVEYRKAKHIEKPWAANDRVMICVSPTRNSLRLIRRGWRVGQRLHADVVAVYVSDSPLGERESKILQNDFSLAERLGIRTVTLKGDVSAQLIGFAKENNVTQVILGHPERTRIQEMIKGSLISDLIKALKTVDIMVVATEKPSEIEH